MKTAKIAIAFVCLVALGLGVAIAAESGPINDKCPMSGKSVDPDKTTSVEVHFCCNNCKGKFDKNPGAYLSKVAKAEEGKCPMSGKDAGDKVSTVTVGFCCGDCKAKFDKDPKANLAKVHAPAKGAK
ncbi:MAG: hypothetical protein GC159_04955 [Phycisphaera sp.]|nr:hypothetical protein [Phycisphaera sp.]